MNKTAQIHLLHSRSAASFDDGDRPATHKSKASLGIVPTGYALERRPAMLALPSPSLRGMSALPYVGRRVEPEPVKSNASLYWGMAAATLLIGTGLTGAYMWGRSIPVISVPVAVSPAPKVVLPPPVAVLVTPINLSSPEPAVTSIPLLPQVSNEANLTAATPVVSAVTSPTTVTASPAATLSPIPLPSMAKVVPPASKMQQPTPINKPTVVPPPPSVSVTKVFPTPDPKVMAPTATVVATPYKPTVITSTPTTAVSRPQSMLIKPTSPTVKPREDTSPILRAPVGSAAIPYVTLKRSALGVDALSTTTVVVTDKKTGLPHAYKLGDDIPGIGVLRMIDPATSTLITAQRAIRLED